MIHYLILAVGAVLLAGCASQKKTVAPPPPPPPLPPPPLPKTFGPETKAPWELYQGLHRLGVPDANMDQGCHVIDFTKPGPNEQIIGKDDKKLDRCEVDEYALDRFEKYQNILEGAYRRPITWVLNGTPEQKTKAVIVRFREILAKKGYEPGSDAFQEALANGLMHFAIFPDNPMVIVQNRSPLQKATQVLVDKGLGEFQDALFAQGGLGRIMAGSVKEVQDLPLEGDAMTTIAEKKGWCTEWSKVLFAVFRMAGLNPYFVSTSDERFQSIEVEVDPTPGKPKKLRIVSGHTYVGIPLKTGDRHFDLLHVVSDFKLPSFYPQRLRHFWADEWSNLGSDLAYQGKMEESANLYRQSIGLNPENGAYHSNLAGNLRNEGKIDDAIQEINRAITLGHDFYFVRFHRIAFSFEKKRYEEVIKESEKLLEGKVHPLIANEIRLYRAFSLTELGRYEEALPEVRQIAQIFPDQFESHNNVGVAIMLMQTKAKVKDLALINEAIQAFEKALQIFPADKQGIQNLELAKKKKKEWFPKEK